MQKAPYYGQIEEIWELNYLAFKVSFFKCRWVQGSQGVTRDKNGFVSVDLRNVGYKIEHFVLAKDVEEEEEEEEEEKDICGSGPIEKRDNG